MSSDYDGKWWVSQNEEWFTNGPCNTRDDAISEGRAMFPDEPFYVGESTHLLNLRKPCIESMLERLENDLWDCTAFDDGPLIDLSKENEQKLQEMVCQFLRDNAAIKNFSIQNPERIEGAEHNRKYEEGEVSNG